jgi:hypothetical protein
VIAWRRASRGVGVGLLAWFKRRETVVIDGVEVSDPAQRQAAVDELADALERQSGAAAPAAPGGRAGGCGGCGAG